MVAVVIPAFNEEARIGSVLRAVKMAKHADEIIVVSDASHDGTADVARQFPGVKVIELFVNLGKGGAMAVGAAATPADVVMFVDADLVGLTPEHVDAIIRPVKDSQSDMCIGVFRGGKFWSDNAQRLAPYISGQRAVRRDLLELVPNLCDLRMGVEVTLNTVAKRHNKRIRRVVLRGVSNTHKEAKMGFVKGTAARAKMYTEIGKAMMKARKKKGTRPRRGSIWKRN